MKTNPSHTPTPWELYDKTSTWAFHSNGKSIGTILKQYENSEANAAFIVRAVNNFDQMLLALKKLEDRTIETSFAHQIAKEAIAKAEGKE